MTTGAPAPSTPMRDDAFPKGTDTTVDRRWVHPALVVLLLATATCWSTGLARNGWANSFYSAAVQAGTKSWKAAFFGASDAANSITVDKPPASLWVMEISARLFGINSWSIQLPQVLLGVASVALLYATVKRAFGPGAALTAGVGLALTPVATLMFRYNNPDALLAFLMIAAVWSLLRGVEDGRTRWILLCGALIGVGFLTKQLQVVLITPGLALTYLVAGQQPALKTRLRQILAGLAATVVVAGWWVALVELWPKDRRPYVGGSSDDSFVSLTFGYNGLGRIRGGGLPPPSGGPTGMGGPPTPFGDAGLARLFTTESATQISWLLPAALIFLVVGLVLRGRAERTDVQRASYLAWGCWLVVTGLVFSVMSGIYHDYYTVALAPAVAALVGVGAVKLWDRRETGWITTVLAATTALTAAWSWVLLGRTPQFVPALRWFVLAAGVLAAAGLILVAILPVTAPRRGTGVSAAGLAVLAALAGPAAYCVHTVDTAHSGSIITAGPATDVALAGLPVMPELNVSGRVARTLAADADSFTWVAAVGGSTDAAGYQLTTDDPVMPLGGFSSGDPSPRIEQFQRYVADGRIHYYIQSSHPPPAFPPPGQIQTQADCIAQWVQRHYPSTKVDDIILYDLTRPVEAR